MKNYFKLSLTACAVMSSMGYATASFAQQANVVNDEEEVYTLEEMIVTATRVERSLLEVPVAVTAVDGDVLEQNNISSIETLSELVPSLTFT